MASQPLGKSLQWYSVVMYAYGVFLKLLQKIGGKKQEKKKKGWENSIFFFLVGYY